MKSLLIILSLLIINTTHASMFMGSGESKTILLVLSGKGEGKETNNEKTASTPKKSPKSKPTYKKRGTYESAMPGCRIIEKS